MVMEHSQTPVSSGPPTEQQLAFERLQQMAHFQAGFLGTASHELRAPINRIIGLHQLILEDLCESPEEERDFLRQAHAGIFEVLQTLDVLIQVSKVDIGSIQPKREPVMVDGVLAKVRELIEKKCINRQCRLEIAASPPALLAEADTQWLQQLLLLLLDGALVAGSQRLSLAAQTADSSTINIQLISDVAVEQWSAPVVATSAEASDPATVDISPGFRYQLAERMARHLKGALWLSPAQEQGSDIVLSLPEANF
jgi:signal transduction histidine kinase